MSKLDDLIRKAKAEIVEPETSDLEVLFGGEVVSFRFTKLDPMVWRNLTASFPARDGSTRDMRLGYNYDLAPSAYPATHIHLMDGEDAGEVTKEQWSDVFARLQSPDLFNISTLLWGMHEWEPQQQVEKAKKARGASKKK